MSKTNESLLKRRQAAVPRGVGQIHPVVAERAENSTVWDVEGREYIDFAGGIAVLNTGHLHPKVIAAVQEQLGKLSHTCFQVLAYEPYIELAEEIAKRVPGDFPKKTLLVTSGSEAVENAVKIARAATGRAGVIAFTGAYHGRTMMIAAMSWGWASFLKMRSMLAMESSSLTPCSSQGARARKMPPGIRPMPAEYGTTLPVRP
ncbi:aminotransferase class III-fold pyridoxal phosphate-dependent enzyme, partial [Pseudomonas aeruginosa]|nr:aminotransferase class III-fold pyridoxal phosphate-dependent enzyme [Pseudomonas aeruginosa]